MIDNANILLTKPLRANLTRQCIRSIRSYIKSNRLEAGCKLPSFQEWTEILGVSIVVVREAFRSMEALGFVDIQHGRGIYLRGADEMDFLDFLDYSQPLNEFTTKDVVEARAMLDLVVLELCIVRTDQETMNELDQILQQMYANPALVAVYEPLHKQFHHIMLEATGNRFLVSIGTPLLNTFWGLDGSGIIQLTDLPYSIEEVDYHAAFLDAIRKRDLSNTRELIDRHLFGSCSKYQVFPVIYD